MNIHLLVRATDKGKPHAGTWGRVEARGLQQKE
nr:MAG TPA: Copper binding octapeptide repeat protein [Caudoviricetes sp.]